MKLLTLEFIAYGPFTEKTLNLSDGNSGVHLIYGPNEAGKSAALRGLTNLFYGIPARTTDNFLHGIPNSGWGAASVTQTVGSYISSDGKGLRTPCWMLRAKPFRKASFLRISVK